MIICKNCGKEINKRSISKLCRSCAIKGQHHSPKTEFKKGIRKIIQCDNCKKEIDRVHSMIRYMHNFCSRNCYIEFRFGKNRIIWKGRFKEARNDYWKKNKLKLLFNKKLYRHKIGETKKYREECLGGISKTKEYMKLQRQKRKALMKGGGELTIQTIQQVYENNIKQFGTLTCYLCLQPILFGKDQLEHKIPLSRNGTNEYNNLGIACQKCNCKKNKKTFNEFMGAKKI